MQKELSVTNRPPTEDEPRVSREAPAADGGHQSASPWLVRLAGWYLERFRRHEPISFSEAFRDVERILIMPEPGVTGALFAMPTIRAFRRGYPSGKIAALVPDEDRDLLEGASELDRVIGYSLPRGVRRLSALGSLAKRLHSYRFDIAIVLDREFDLERVLLCYATGAKVRAGMQSTSNEPFLNLEVSRKVPGRTRAQLGLEIARVIGIDVSDLTLRWVVPERERRLAEQLVHFRKPRDEELLVGFDPGPGRGGTSMSLAQQARLLDKLCTDYQAKAILLTSPENQDVARRLESMLSREPIVVQQRRMRDVVSLLGQCDLFVAGNTDLVYFAVAMDVPTVSLMAEREIDQAALPENRLIEIVKLVPGERFPIEEFIERTEAVLLAGAG
jgi:ADP-heptose:LPS heptosyltransferase